MYSWCLLDLFIKPCYHLTRFQILSVIWCRSLTDWISFWILGQRRQGGSPGKDYSSLTLLRQVINETVQKGKYKTWKFIFTGCIYQIYIVLISQKKILIYFRKKIQLVRFWKRFSGYHNKQCQVSKHLYVDIKFINYCNSPFTCAAYFYALGNWIFWPPVVKSRAKKSNFHNKYDLLIQLNFNFRPACVILKKDRKMD